MVSLVDMTDEQKKLEAVACQEVAQAMYKLARLRMQPPQPGRRTTAEVAAMYARISRILRGIEPLGELDDR